MLSISIVFKSQQAISSSENLLLVAFGMDDAKSIIHDAFFFRLSFSKRQSQEEKFTGKWPF